MLVAWVLVALVPLAVVVLALLLLGLMLLALVLHQALSAHAQHATSVWCREDFEDKQTFALLSHTAELWMQCMEHRANTAAFAHLSIMWLQISVQDTC